MYYVRIYSSEKNKSLLFSFETEKRAVNYLIQQCQIITNYFAENPEKYKFHFLKGTDFLKNQSISLNKENNCLETVHLAYRHISEDTISSAILEFEILSDLNSDYYTALELLKL